MKKKQYDITKDLKEKKDQLNKDYLKYYNDIEKTQLYRSRHLLKTYILLNEILDQMIDHQDKVSNCQKLIGKSTKTYIDKINKQINYKQHISEMKNKDIQQYSFSGLWMTMCGFIVLMFVKELLSNHYLIHFYVDSLIAAFAFIITLHHVDNQFKIIQKYQMPLKPLYITLLAFGISLIVNFFMYNSPFDITFAILVVALLTNKKIMEKQMEM